MIVPYMVAVIALAYAYKALLLPRLKKFNSELLRTRYVVLAIAALVWVAFALIEPMAYKATAYITTYAISVAFYELILKWIENFFSTSRGGGFYSRARHATFRKDERDTL